MRQTDRPTVRSEQDERPEGSITVLTVTRGRPAWLLRCLQAVLDQSGVEAEHLVLIDDCDTTDRALSEIEHPRLTWLLRRRRPGETSGPGHLARLRNLMIRMARTEWVAFLDDDNVFLPEHLSSLLDCARRHAADAVHSWMRVFDDAGVPYLEARWPWCRDDAQAARKYAEMASRGVVTPGDNIVRDALANFPARCVDTSAWLLRRAALGEAPMDPHFTRAEFEANKAEDDHLHATIARRGLKVVCTEAATLSYTLGGYSTNHDGRSARAETWRWTS